MIKTLLAGMIHPRHRRYATTAVIAELKHAEPTPTGAVTYNIMTDEWTEWYGVADDDPRLDTVEHLK